MKKRHIAFYIGSLHKGGAERVFVNLAEYFYEQGYQVTIVTQYQYENEYTYSEGIVRILSDLTPWEEGNRLSNILRRHRKLRRIWKIQKPDLVLSCIGKNNFMAILTTLFLKTKVVVSVVGEPTEEYYTGVMRFLAKTLFLLADGIVLQTKEASRFFPVKIRNKAVILKNSLNPAFIKERFEGDREKVIVSVGRLDANKNQALLLRAFLAIAEEYPDYRVILYGEGEERAKLEQIVKEAGLRSRISLPGVTTDVVEAIYKASVFVLTSNTEGMPNALIEAMALGLPVISTDCPCGGPKDLIQQKENGILIPVHDEKALQVALRFLLDNPEHAQEMGRKAAKIQKELDPAVTNQAWKVYFEAVIDQKSDYRKQDFYQK